MLGRSSGGGHGNLLQYSCLENPMDRGAWWVSVHRVAKGQTLKRLSTHTCTVKGGTPWKEERETEGWFREEPYFTTCLIQDFLGTMLLKNETKSCLSSPRGHQKCLTLNSLHLKKKKSKFEKSDIYRKQNSLPKDRSFGSQKSPPLPFR